jgi:hypothetical protein
LRIIQRALTCGALSLIFGVTAALAQGGGFHPRINAQPTKIGGKRGVVVSVNDHAVLSLRSNNAASAARASMVAQRIKAATSGPGPWTIVAANMPGIGWTLTVNNYLITTIAADDAKDHRSTPADLAKNWARALQSALAEPPFQLPGGLVTPVGETRTIVVKGAVRPSDIAIRIDDSDIATASFDPRTRQLVIRGKTPGRTAITLTSFADGPVQDSMPIAVMDFAARFDANASVAVTGSSPSQQLVQQGLCNGLSQSIDADLNAQLALPGSLASVTAPGNYLIPVQAQGDGLLPAKTNIRVAVRTLDLAPLDAETLFYSNNPETIKAGGELFAGRVYADVPARLDFHHQNIGDKVLGFQVSLMNPGSSPIAVQIISGVATPAIDTIQVGRRAGAEFLKSLEANSGVVVDVPAFSMVPVITQRLPPGMTVSGIVQARIVSGDSPVVVRVNADDANTWIGSPVWTACERLLGNSWRLTPVLPLPANHDEILKALSKQIYPKPHITRDVSYAAGSTWRYIEMGRADALHSIDNSSRLDGNYGVDYDIDIHLSNPSDGPKNIGIYFFPEAGPAAGVFQVDSGPIIEFDPTDTTEQPMIAKIPLAAGENRDVHVRTIPLNGGYYPAAVVVHQL